MKLSDTLTELQIQADTELKEHLKGRRMRVVIEGDAFEIYKAHIHRAVFGKGFTVYEEWL